MILASRQAIRDPELADKKVFRMTTAAVLSIVRFGLYLVSTICRDMGATFVNFFYISSTADLPILLT
jgi:hypothetical protein